MPAATLRVLGHPAPQGSKKHVGKGRMVESSRRLPAWRRAVKKAAVEAVEAHGTIEGPVTVRVAFYMPRPGRTRFPAAPAGPPDLDKLMRAVGDGLEAGGLIVNDSRIVAWTATKNWTTMTEPPGARIVVEPEGEVSP